jgi:deferrochelatase/peroxidase EfeB
LDQFVWVADEGPEWLHGGTYLVARRIRMKIEVWDRATLGDQENTIGRLKVSGAPLGGHDEFDTPDLTAKAPHGPVIPDDAHIRLSAPSLNGGTRILRRGYSFTDGFDDVTGELDAGLFFISFQRDPSQFEAVQRQLGADALNEYISHTSSAVFAVPPGIAPGTYAGQELLG